MSNSFHPCPARRAAAGMTLVEAVVALLLLSVCLVPAANALRGAIAAPGNTALAGRDLDCVTARMETVLGESYARLLAAAGSMTARSAYSTAANAACPAINVFIARYGNDDTVRLGTSGAGDNLLYVGVRLADTGAGNAFPLATLVTR
ncbi:prepilin-type N-terminal cleavage/methylation domain-containing protein [Pseudoduganella sp. SL102]|uniref:prepilin-type N-terminal cleavage/methylation domain-containing protein n=1 Tax=Pseudoduganella sp. SL102 TaxID=2995154 RepID=UPI00248BF413|nr:prepilin-type N-terminal cleavage/methylation domain-containing protein [Pseudoduganella sp. SL102]WBS01067.1 prepilin-type N-terminal cleavage/methylation domain-containing protein [Pseudoduganella sp. SL102]